MINSIGSGNRLYVFDSLFPFGGTGSVPSDETAGQVYNKGAVFDAAIIHAAIYAAVAGLFITSRIRA